MNLNFRISILASIVFFMTSCSKEKDTTKPTVAIHTPQHGLEVNGNDTIQVIATVSDDINIKSVSISLINENDISLLASVSRTPNTQTYELNVPFIFDDNQLPSGQYFLSVRADDGENTHSEYVAINYNEPNRVREGVFVVSSNPSMSHFYLLDVNFSATLFKSIAGDYLNAEVNSVEQQLVYASSQNGAVSATNILTLGTDWNVPILNSSSAPFYTGSIYHNENLYLGKRDGYVVGFNKYGSPQFSSVGNSGYYAESMLVTDQHIITEEHSISSNVVKLIYYPLSSGIIYKETTVNTTDIIGIYEKDIQTLILLANDATSSGEILWYDIPTGGITAPYTPNIGEIDVSMEIGVGIYLVAEAGNLTVLNTTNFTKTVWLSGTNATNFWYDGLTNELYVGSGSVLNVYDFTSKALKGTYAHTSEIKDVTFWYNR